MSSETEEIREQLSAYLDGELTDQQARRVEQGVRADPQLAAELERLRAVRNLLRDLPRASAPPGLAERVVQRAERVGVVEAARARRPAAWWLGRLAAAAVFLVAAGVAVLVVAKLSVPSGTARMEPDVAVKEGFEGEDAKRDVTVAVAPPPRLDNGRRLAKGGPAGPSAAPKGYAEAYVGKRAAVAPPGPANAAFGDAPAAQLFINTDNLVLANRKVQRVLATNGIVPVDSLPPEPVPAKVRVSRANFYDQIAAGADRVDFDVVLGDAEVQKIVGELNVLRAEQNVAQVPTRDVPFLGQPPRAPVPLAAKDTRGRGDLPAEERMYKSKGLAQRELEVAKPTTAPAVAAEAIVARPPEPTTRTQVAATQLEGQAARVSQIRSKLPAAGAAQGIARAPTTRPAQPQVQVFNFQSRQVVQMLAGQRGQATQLAVATQRAIAVGANVRRLRITLLKPEAAGRAAEAAGQ